MTHPSVQMFALACALLLFTQAIADGEWLAPIPGMFTAAGVGGSLFGRGYDPILGEVKAPVLDFHYNGYEGDSNVWRNPETGVSYKRPDEVIVFDNSASSTTTDVTVCRTFEQYAEFEERTHSSGFSIIVISYGEGDVTGYMREIFASNESIVMLTNRISTTHQLQMRWGPDIIKYLMQDGRKQSQTAIAQAQKLLPASRKTKAERNAYQAFINRFGTHYVDGAFFGGNLQGILVVKRSLVQKHSEEWAGRMVRVGQVNSVKDLGVARYSYLLGDRGRPLGDSHSPAGCPGPGPSWTQRPKHLAHCSSTTALWLIWQHAASYELCRACRREAVGPSPGVRVGRGDS